VGGFSWASVLLPDKPSHRQWTLKKYNKKTALWAVFPDFRLADKPSLGLPEESGQAGPSD
jgi:hypothetical protein